MKILADRHEKWSPLGANMAQQPHRKNKSGQDNPKLPATWTIRPDDELRELMRKAIASTGKARGTLIKMVVRKELPGLTRQIAEAQREASSEFEGGDEGNG